MKWRSFPKVPQVVVQFHPLTALCLADWIRELVALMSDARRPDTSDENNSSLKWSWRQGKVSIVFTILPLPALFPPFRDELLQVKIVWPLAPAPHPWRPIRVVAIFTQKMMAIIFQKMLTWWLEDSAVPRLSYENEHFRQMVPIGSIVWVQ